MLPHENAQRGSQEESTAKKAERFRNRRQMCGVHLFGQQRTFSSPSPQKQDEEKSPVLFQIGNDGTGLKSCAQDLLDRCRFLAEPCRCLSAAGSCAPRLRTWLPLPLARWMWSRLAPSCSTCRRNSRPFTSCTASSSQALGSQFSNQLTAFVTQNLPDVYGL